MTLQREQFRCVFALGLGSPFLVVELYFLVLERVGGEGFVIIGAAETETELMKRVFITLTDVGHSFAIKRIRPICLVLLLSVLMGAL